MEKYAADYSTMQQYLIYEESPPFEEVLIRLKWLQGLVRLKKENISLEEIVKMALVKAKDVDGETVSVTVIIPTEHTEKNNVRYQVDFIRRGPLSYLRLSIFYRQHKSRHYSCMDFVRIDL